ncbi:metallophosphoesterase [Pedobacter sp. V48]|uniref:metallophosphoesterase family protein n=1 Tax=Pedobacter sp. V48 TaxID=509635 RepID=UPI0003E4A3EA|nr:metallophosphoesterase [Pedobacter sp. V48]ETZ22815.1 hypothetical protein N824_21225 [Pedobacter sp. V48]
MGKKLLRIAIISDLHCHPELEDSKKNSTLLFSAKLRSPVNEHPVEDLLEVIAKDQIEVDVVLSPGDITHQSDQQGFFSGWSYIKELAAALGSKQLYATIGNHDVDSRHKASAYSFDIPKKVKQNFPLPEAYLESFWGSGFSFIEDKDFQLLVINSTHYHTHYSTDKDGNPTIKGKIDSNQLEAIEKYLSENNDDEKIKIMLCHHHPVNHARRGLGDDDFITNGEDLLHLLGRFKFDLVIHGHKHDPLLRYFPTSCGVDIPILSSGSFSATDQILYATIFNYFHVLEISKENGHAVATIETYTFRNKIGWGKTRDDGFLPFTGFGYKEDLLKIESKVVTLLKSKSFVEWPEVLIAAPEIAYLTAQQQETLKNMLEAKKIYLGDKIGVGPKHAYYAGN